MDKITQLLAEAKPLYLQRRRQKRLTASMLPLLLCVWLGTDILLKTHQVQISDAQLEAYYSSLYGNENYFSYNVEKDNVLPLDGYGFYEV